ncbi:C40 family peptidase [Nocardioides sp.]|uniref:C40 family peptidase n=1 Tax=Nocardioides sp. TaxID=35761 RepID=UPI002B6C1C41|nr:C40 family peptidase [Nocardioides sp.]HXH80246.1 C40 family peptidase [Nocardioides sp.]
MPVRRLVRSCALTLVTLGVTATTLAVAPAHAVEQGDDSRSGGAVAMTQSQVTKYDERQAARQQSAAQRFESRITSAKQTALAQMGDPYSWGGVGPNAFDCSGLIYFSYRQAGFDVPRTSGAQAAYTRRVAKQDMRPGDLMFFHAGGAVYHAAIFLRWERGRAMMLDAPGSGKRVQVIAPWTDSWFGGTLR